MRRGRCASAGGGGAVDRRRSSYYVRYLTPQEEERPVNPEIQSAAQNLTDRENLPAADAAAPPVTLRADVDRRRAAARSDPRGPLSAERKRLVEDNLGLVGVHLKRFVPPRSRPDCDREDLYQEGCLGLIEAGGRYDPGSAIPFASYALARIHRSVSAAMHEEPGLIRTPDPRRRRRRSRADASAQDIAAPRTRPVVQSLDDGADSIKIRESLAAETDADENATAALGATIRERIRDKHQRALRAAAEALLRSGGAPASRPQLLRRLVEERRLVARESHRTPLRQLARETECSFSLVNRCDQALESRACAMLAGDPEFGELRRRALSSEAGLDAAVDGDLERAVVTVGAAALKDRVDAASGPDLAALLAAILETLDRTVLATWIADLYETLDATARESIWRTLSNPSSPVTEAPRRHREGRSISCLSDEAGRLADAENLQRCSDGYPDRVLARRTRHAVPRASRRRSGRASQRRSERLRSPLG
ncbi:MAG: hypothetical protein DPW13_10525 [Planctomycetes bacterium]|nr:hypothetical protein [Planctomycetota bacterium]